jgi:hypothetical protein
MAREVACERPPDDVCHIHGDLPSMSWAGCQAGVRARLRADAAMRSVGAKLIAGLKFPPAGEVVPEVDLEAAVAEVQRRKKFEVSQRPPMSLLPSACFASPVGGVCPSSVRPWRRRRKLKP